MHPDWLDAAIVSRRRNVTSRIGTRYTTFQTEKLNPSHDDLWTCQTGYLRGHRRIFTIFLTLSIGLLNVLSDMENCVMRITWSYVLGCIFCGFHFCYLKYDIYKHQLRSNMKKLFSPLLVLLVSTTVYWWYYHPLITQLYLARKIVNTRE